MSSSSSLLSEETSGSRSKTVINTGDDNAAAAATITTSKKKTNNNNNNSCRIRAKDVRHQFLLQAAADGDLKPLQSIVYKNYYDHCNNNANNNNNNNSNNSNKKNRRTTDDDDDDENVCDSGSIIDEDGVEMLRRAVCSSGCSVLHWAAGNNHLHVVQFLLSSMTTLKETTTARRHRLQQQQEGQKAETEVLGGSEDHNHQKPHQEEQKQQVLRIFCNVDQPAVKKSLGRTSLHYCCRNGHIETAKWLVSQGGANVRAKAKHGVTPFQMAVWQNRLDICQWLVEEHGIVAADEVNDFQCSPVHWIGICPVDRANYNRKRRRRRRQRRGQSCGVQGDDDDDDDLTMSDDDHVCDDTTTETTWYEDGRDLIPLATWLAEQPGIDFHRRQRQGHTSLHKAAWGGHLALIKYLHTQHDMWDDVVDDAGNYSASLSDMANTPRHDAISKYLREECSKDRVQSCKKLGVPTTASKAEIRKAYLTKARMFHPDRQLLHSSDNDHQLLSMGENSNVDTFTDGTTDKYSFDFDEIRNAYVHLTERDGHGNQSNPAHSLNLMLQASGISNEEAHDEDSFFKARLVAVLLEYGDKGIDLSNIRKKWKQVWPNEPFPTTIIQTRKSGSGGKDGGGPNSKEIPLSSFLVQKAGDFIRLETDSKTGSLRVYPRNCSRAQVAEVASSHPTTKLHHP